jgi:hypothetical protein
MNDCSNCSKSIEVTPTSHVCSTEGKKYVISDYPSQGVNCKTLDPITNKQQLKVKSKSKDPLINFFNNRKQPKMDDAEKKIIEAFDKNMGMPQQVYPVESSGEEINVRSALGWIVAAILGGALIGSWLLGVL